MPHESGLKSRPNSCRWSNSHVDNESAKPARATWAATPGDAVKLDAAVMLALVVVTEAMKATGRGEKSFVKWTTTNATGNAGADAEDDDTLRTEELLDGTAGELSNVVAERTPPLSVVSGVQESARAKMTHCTARSSRGLIV